MVAALAEQQEQFHQRLLELTPTDSEELQAAWHVATAAHLDALEADNHAAGEPLVEAFYLLVTCKDERQQVDLLKRFKTEGLECKALLS